MDSIDKKRVIKKKNKRSLKSDRKCVIDLNRPCSRKSKSKRRYKRDDLEKLYQICYPDSQIKDIRNKNMTILCKEIISVADVIDESSSYEMLEGKKSSKSSSKSKYRKKTDKTRKMEKNIQIKELDRLLTNTNARENFINSIINGKILINNIKIDYPYILKENSYTGKSIINNIPCNIFSAIKILKGEIKFLSSERGVTGYPFKVCLDTKCSKINIPKFGIKVLPYVNDRDWVSYDCVREHQQKIKGTYFFKRKEATKECIKIDSKRPENVEAKLLHLLSEFVMNNKTPHIVLPIMNFVCNINDLLKGTSDISSNVDWLQRDSSNEILGIANVLITEWATGGDLKVFILNNLREWSKTSHCEMIWSSIFFQLIFTLVIIFEKYPNFRHNDLKVDNILVTITDMSPKTVGYYLYYVDGKYYSVPNLGFQIKLWDFDLSCIKGVVDNYKTENMQEYGIRDTKNQYYDIHCFLNYLRLWVVGNSNRKYVPENVQNFWRRCIPLKYRYVEHLPNVYWSRVIPDDEYLTPLDILRLETDNKSGLFNKFLFKGKENEIFSGNFLNKYNLPDRNVRKHPRTSPIIR